MQKKSKNTDGTIQRSPKFVKEILEATGKFEIVVEQAAQPEHQHQDEVVQQQVQPEVNGGAGAEEGIQEQQDQQQNANARNEQEQQNARDGGPEGGQQDQLDAAKLAVEFIMQKYNQVIDNNDLADLNAKRNDFLGAFKFDTNAEKVNKHLQHNAGKMFDILYKSYNGQKVEDDFAAVKDKREFKEVLKDILTVIANVFRSKENKVLTYKEARKSFAEKAKAEKDAAGQGQQNQL